MAMHPLPVPRSKATGEGNGLQKTKGQLRQRLRLRAGDQHGGAYPELVAEKIADAENMLQRLAIHPSIDVFPHSIDLLASRHLVPMKGEFRAAVLENVRGQPLDIGPWRLDSSLSKQANAFVHELTNCHLRIKPSATPSHL